MATILELGANTTIGVLGERNAALAPLHVDVAFEQRPQLLPVQAQASPRDRHAVPHLCRARVQEQEVALVGLERGINDGLFSPPEQGGEKNQLGCSTHLASLYHPPSSSYPYLLSDFYFALCFTLLCFAFLFFSFLSSLLGFLHSNL
jgi:hypothetical protein